MEAQQSLLEIDQLKTQFTTEAGIVKAVDGVSLRVYPGKTLGVVGESGCGKTVLALSVMGLLQGSGGVVRGSLRLCRGEELLDLTQPKVVQAVRGKEIAMIFQDPMTSLNPVLSIGFQLEETIARHTPCSKKERRARSLSLLQTVGIARGEEILRSYPHQLSGGMAQRVMIGMALCGLEGDQRNRYPHEFSGGQRQRIAIARALALQPSLVICDEPVSALDGSIQAQILNLLEQLQRERQLSYLFISHDLSVVDHIAQEVGVLYLGHMVELGPKEQVLSQALHPYTQALIRAVPVGDPTADPRRGLLEGEMPSAFSPPAGCPFHPRCPLCKEICTRVLPTLVEAEPGHFVKCHLVGGSL